MGGAIFIYAIQNGSNVTVIDSTFTASAGSAIETINSNYYFISFQLHINFSDNIALKDDVYILLDRQSSPNLKSSQARLLS